MLRLGGGRRSFDFSRPLLGLGDGAESGGPAWWLPLLAFAVLSTALTVLSWEVFARTGWGADWWTPILWRIAGIAALLGVGTAAVTSLGAGLACTIGCWLFLGTIVVTRYSPSPDVPPPWLRPATLAATGVFFGVLAGLPNVLFSRKPLRLTPGAFVKASALGIVIGWVAILAGLVAGSFLSGLFARFTPSSLGLPEHRYDAGFAGALGLVLGLAALQRRRDALGGAFAAWLIGAYAGLVWSRLFHERLEMQAGSFTILAFGLMGFVASYPILEGRLDAYWANFGAALAGGLPVVFLVAFDVYTKNVHEGWIRWQALSLGGLLLGLGPGLWRLWRGRRT